MTTATFSLRPKLSPADGLRRKGERKRRFDSSLLGVLLQVYGSQRMLLDPEPYPPHVKGNTGAHREGRVDPTPPVKLEMELGGSFGQFLPLAENLQPSVEYWLQANGYLS